jgi:hypothetical protein
MRCPDCSKFVGLDMADPEVGDLEVGEDGTVTCEVRIVRTCAECGQELKEANFSLEAQVPVEGHEGEGHELSVEESSVEPIEEGGGRYAKSYYGATVNATVTCSCGKFKEDVELSDKCSASGMDELV